MLVLGLVYHMQLPDVFQGRELLDALWGSRHRRGRTLGRGHPRVGRGGRRRRRNFLRGRISRNFKSGSRDRGRRRRNFLRCRISRNLKSGSRDRGRNCRRGRISRNLNRGS